MANFIKERDFGEVMSETFNFFIKEIKPLAKILLIFIGPFIVINTYLAFKYQAIVEQWVENVIQTQNIENFPTEYLYIFIIGIFQGIVLATVVSAYIKLRTLKESNTIELSDIWEITSKSILHVTFGQILIFAAVIIGLFIFLKVFGVAVSMLLILIWAFYVMVSMFLLSFIIVYEQKTIFEAIRRTLFVVKKNRWSVFGALIVFGIIIGISNLLFSFIIEKLIAILSTGSVATIFATLLTSVVTVAFSSIMAILPAYLYASFIATKENPELLEKINKIDSDLIDNDNITQ